MYVLYVCSSVFMNYNCTTHLILPFITSLQTKFLVKYCIKRVVALSNTQKFSKGKVHDVSEEGQKISGEVQNYLRGGAHLLKKTSPQNPLHTLNDFCYATL